MSSWATLGRPGGVAVDGPGNVFVVFNNQARVEKFDNDGGFLATWGSQGSGDGEFYSPNGVAVDGSGNVFVADTGNHRIAKFGVGVSSHNLGGHPRRNRDRAGLRVREGRRARL